MEIYNTLAPVYDKMYSSKVCQEENRAIKAMINYKGGRVLDIGCGTGLFLELFDASPEEYTGIDPSGKMLEIAHAKFPSHVFMVSCFETLPVRAKYDLIVCLFGAASYIEPGKLNRIFSHLKQGGRYFFMFYKPGYLPDYYNGSESLVYRGGENFIPGKTIDFNNFIIKAGKNA